MVLINGNKYACETCIKGHRSSTCRHTDRALFEIKKKGRPVTQCDHCRELRKTKQVHVKCICEAKEDHATMIVPPAIKKGHTKIPGSATFPNGLPEALGASVALQTSPEPVSSDSDNGGCKCKTGTGTCNCCTARKSTPRARPRRSSASGMRPTAADASTDESPHAATHSSRAPSHILARLAELRPVLPRPVDRHSLGFTHGNHPRHHSHENLLFSPYGRAYDLVYEQSHNRSVPNISLQNNPATALPTEEQRFRDQLRALEAVAASSIPLNRSVEGNNTTGPVFPSTCGCGDNCSCPGCRQHNGGSPSPSAFSSCTNPGVCNTCLDCTILSLPASLPPDTNLSIFDAYPAESIDDWIRQVSSLPRGSPSNAGGASQQQQQHQQGAWDNYLSPIAEPPPNLDGRYMVQECCGVMCKCSPETCQCDISRGDGYDCRREALPPASLALFASSGDRTITTSSFDNIRRPPIPSNGGGSASGNYGAGLVRSQSTGGLHPGSEPWNMRNYLAAPDIPTPLTRSRSSSSSSSRSSHQYQFTPFDPDPSADPFAAPPFTSFSLPDLGASLQPNFPSEMRNMMNASPTRSLYGGENGYPISNPDSDGYSAELEAEDTSWDRQIPAPLQHHPWPRTN